MTVARFLFRKHQKPSQRWSRFSTSAASHQDLAATAKYPSLFAPLTLHSSDPDPSNHIRLPNRALMGSMHSGLEGHSLPGFLRNSIESWAARQPGRTVNTGPSAHDLSRLAEYCRQRAAGGVGLIVTGGIAPHWRGWVGPFASQLTNTTERDMHKVVTEAVHSNQIPIYGTNETEPARIVMQLLHTGRYAYHPFSVAPSKTKSPITPFTPRAMSKQEIHKLQDHYVRAATLAREAGYDGVELMGSEGYLLSQFFAAEKTNKRTDEYGPQSLENRARFAIELVEKTRAALGPDFIIVFRLSLLEFVAHGLQFEESVQIAQWLETAGVSMINTGIGWHEARVPTIATSVPRAAFAFPTKELKKRNVVSVPLVATNRINAPDTAEEVLAGGSSDMVSMARPFLADPELMLKSATGREDEINTCIGCNQACLDHVFFGKVASCLVNPEACHETEFDFKPLPVEQQKKIGVIGAGPSGCAFAISAARKGHKVTLYDKDTAIGGQFHMAKQIPGKEEFYEALRYFETSLKKWNVDVKLNTELSLDDMDQACSSGDIDRWIVATGVDPRDPRIPGQEDATPDKKKPVQVVSYIDVLKNKVPVGDRVAVIGAGGIGFDVSEYLLHHDDSKPRVEAKDVDPAEFWKAWGVDTSLKERGGLTMPSLTDVTGGDAQHKPRRSKIYLMQRKKGKVGGGLGKTTGWIHRATLNNSGAVEMLNGLTYERIDADKGVLVVKNSKTGIEQELEVDTIVICAGQLKKDELFQNSQDRPALKDKVYPIGGAYEAGELDAKRAIDMGTRLAVRIHEDEVVPGKHAFAAPQEAEEHMMFMLRKYFM